MNNNSRLRDPLCGGGDGEVLWVLASKVRKESGLEPWSLQYGPRLSCVDLVKLLEGTDKNHILGVRCNLIRSQ